MTQARLDEIKELLKDGQYSDLELGELWEAAATSVALEARVAALEEANKKP
jgi:hypothetical protein